MDETLAILCTSLWEKCHWSRAHRNLCPFPRQCLLTVSLYIRLVRCLFWCERLKKVIVTVLTEKDFKNH